MARKPDRVILSDRPLMVAAIVAMGIMVVVAIVAIVAAVVLR